MKSEKFLQMATSMLADEFVRLGNLPIEVATELSSKIIPTIDWEDDALMHKGFGWMAKTYLRYNMPTDLVAFAV